MSEDPNKEPSKEFKEMMKQADQDKQELIRETNLIEIVKAYAMIIKRDFAAVATTFLCALTTYTDRHSQSIMNKSPSSTGKTYIPLQVTSIFPKEDIITLAGASPTSFFHDLRNPVYETATDANGQPKLDKLNRPVKHIKYYLVDLERKIIIFLDQPHYELLKRLRAAISKDQKELEFQITDRTQSGAHRTKHIVLRGYFTVIYCSAKQSTDEQENTRNIILSPETSQEKLRDAIDLITTEEIDYKTFQQLVDEEPSRRWLRERIRMIRDAHIEEINLTPDDSQYLKDEFLKRHPFLLPRHCRDYPRVTALAKAHALLNLWGRRKNPDDKTIEANRTDIDAALNLYDMIAESNEIGLSPWLWSWYSKILRTYWAVGICPNSVQVMRRHLLIYHEPLSRDTLQKDIIPALEGVSLVSAESNPDDKRRTIYAPVTKTDQALLDRGLGKDDKKEERRDGTLG